MLGKPSVQCVIVILAIATDAREPRKVFRTNQREEVDRRNSIIERGTRNQDHEQQPNGINHHMPLPPLDFLPTLIPALGPSDFRRLDRLTVDTHRTGRGVTSGLHADTRAQHLHDFGPRPVLAPLREVFIDGTLRSQVLR